MNPSKKKVLFNTLATVCLLATGLWGCASQDVRMGSLKLGGNDYKSLLKEQMERDHAETTVPDKLPKMTSLEYERLGDAHFRQGNLETAYLQYEKALPKHPEKTRIQYKKGLVLLAKGRNEEAIEEFQKVLKKNSDHALALEGIGRALFRMGAYEPAKEHFQHALRVDPKLWRVHSFLGVIHDYQKQPETAIHEYQAAIRLKPDEGLLYNNLGVSYSLMGDYERAVAAFSEALKTRSSHVKIYNNLGLALSELGRYEEALEAFRRGVGEAQAYNNLGCTYLQDGDRDKAIRSFEKAMELSPTFYAKAGENLRKVKNDFFSQVSFDSNDQYESEAPMNTETRRKGKEPKGTDTSDTRGEKKSETKTLTPKKQKSAHTAQERSQSEEKLNIAIDSAELDTEGTLTRSSFAVKSEPKIKSVAPVSDTHMAGETRLKKGNQGGVEAEKDEEVVSALLRTGRYTLHMATFRDSTKANEYVDELRKQGLKAFRWETYLPGTGKWHRACVGNFTTSVQAQVLAKDLEQNGFKPTVAKLPGALK
jgi:tetratricopeptide (TPR) repeat protein